MPRLLCSLLLCVLVIPITRGADDAKGKDDAKKIEGTWKPTSAELAGKAWPEELVKKMTLVVADGKYSVTIGEQTDKGEVKVDPAKDPRTMDIVGGKGGPNEGKTLLAIYQLTGDKLRICYDLSGKARPKEFKTAPGTELFLVEYQRQKP
jgi:uncharacterized protein (TIGR03067 family)